MSELAAPVEILEQLLDVKDGDEVDGWIRLDSVHIDDSRWMELRWLIVRMVGDPLGAWAAPYEVGLTEMQECEPFEYQGDPVTLIRVKPKIVTTHTWEIA